MSNLTAPETCGICGKRFNTYPAKQKKAVTRLTDEELATRKSRGHLLPSVTLCCRQCAEKARRRNAKRAALKPSVELGVGEAATDQPDDDTSMDNSISELSASFGSSLRFFKECSSNTLGERGTEYLRAHAHLYIPPAQQHAQGTEQEQNQAKAAANAWTKDEDKTLLEAQKRLGGNWGSISELLPGRQENTVKSRYYYLLRRVTAVMPVRAAGELRRAGREAASFFLLCLKTRGSMPSTPPRPHLAPLSLEPETDGSHARPPVTAAESSSVKHTQRIDGNVQGTSDQGVGERLEQRGCRAPTARLKCNGAGPGSVQLICLQRPARDH